MGAPSLTDPMKEIPVPANGLDLEATLNCGQVFHWRRHGPGWVGALGEEAVYMEQRPGKLLVPRIHADRIARYLALDHPLPKIYASFPMDPAMIEAVAFAPGMRILRQPRWECLATFITSSMKQVAHIAQMSHALRIRFGKQIEWDGLPLFAYPTPARMAQASELELRTCGLGFRAKNLLRSAQMIACGEVDLEAIAQLDDSAAREQLCRLPGVGTKVANCVLLFGYERLESFPIDVWIERILRQLYFPRRRTVATGQLRAFTAEHFGEFGGYAQQYLFHHARMTWVRPKPKSKQGVGIRKKQAKSLAGRRGA